MPYVSVDVDVDFYDLWDQLSENQKETILDELRGGVPIDFDRDFLADLIYDIEYRGLHTEKSGPDLLKGLAYRIETA